MGHAVHKVTHAFHKIGHAVSHAVHEVVKHPLETLGVAGMSLLIPGNPLGVALGIGGSTASAGLTAMGSMPDTALGAAEATGSLASLGSAASTAASIGSALKTASKVANVAGPVLSLANMTKKPEINMQLPVTPVVKPKPQVLSGQDFSSLLGDAKDLFALTKTKVHQGSFGVDLSDKFSLL